MGPTSIVHLNGHLTDERLDVVDTVLARLSEDLKRTRKGRVWSARIQGRPVDIHVEESSDAADTEPVSIVLAAGCNERVDYDVLRTAATALSSALTGRCTDPTK